MKKLNLLPDIKKKEQIELYKQGVANQHRAFGGTIITPNDNTPDGIQFNGYHEYSYDEANPFTYVCFDGETQIFYGGSGKTHHSFRDAIKRTYGDNAYIDILYGVHGRYYIDGRYYLIDFDAIPKQCVVFTFWKLQDVNLINQIVYEVCKEKNFFNKEIFIANGQSPMIHWNDFTPGDFDGEIENNSQQLIQHLLPPEQKHKATEPYRQMRGEIQGKKLGNMTQAEWNNIKYGNIAESEKTLKKCLINEAGIKILSILPELCFETVSKYYNNGDLTIDDYGKRFNLNICKRLNEVLTYTSLTDRNINGMSIAKLFKTYGKRVDELKENNKAEKDNLFENTLPKHFDAAARSHFSISGEKLDKYCHVIDDVLDEMSNSFNTNKTLTKESLSELCDDNELQDVMSSFEPQQQLNSKFWNENKQLNPKVRLRLLDIADKFYDSLETSWVKPSDVIFTGSLCNYNWSKYSDVDLHIIIDFNEVDERTNFVKDYFDTKKKIWNKEHEDLTIYGFPVELYIQDKNEEHNASGIFSLYKNKWLIEPNPNNFNAENIDKKKIASKVMNCADKIDELFELANQETDEHKIETIGLKAKKLFTKIKSIRKNALKNGGEMSPGNIFYKALKRLGYIGKIIELKARTFDKINSIK